MVRVYHASSGIQRKNVLNGLKYNFPDGIPHVCAHFKCDLVLHAIHRPWYKSQASLSPKQLCCSVIFRIRWVFRINPQDRNTAAEDVRWSPTDFFWIQTVIRSAICEFVTPIASMHEVYEGISDRDGIETS